MIISRSSLQTFQVTSKDADIPVLDNIHLTAGGTMIGCSRNVVLAISPVLDEIKEKLHLKEACLKKGVTFSSALAKKILKNMPTDKLYDGLLEHVDVDNSAGSRIDFTFYDGEESFEVIGKRYPDEYTVFGTIIKKAMAGRNGIKLVVNRTRLRLLLEAMDKACPDTSGESPIFLELCDNNTIIMRCINMKNGQRALAVMWAYNFDEKKWLKDQSWEKELKRGIGVRPKYVRSNRKYKTNKRRRTYVRAK